jgi:DNA-binding NarL/FixJ family response regulator
MSNPIRVILADDHAVVRKGIKEFLEEMGDIAVIAEASDGEEALRLITEQLPDVAVLDIQMPKLSGVEVTRRLRAKSPQLRILILTAYDDEPYIFALLQAGANGYVLKTASSDELVRAVKTVHAGGSALDPKVAQKVMAQISTGKPFGEHDESVERLTERELDVLRFAAKGLTNRAIGQQLGISERTVQGHLANIYAKLNVGTRTEAVIAASQRGWIILDKE